jgi:hypothetical protein
VVLAGFTGSGGCRTGWGSAWHKRRPSEPGDGAAARRGRGVVGEAARVQQGGQQLQRVHDAWARAVEVGVAIGHIHPSGPPRASPRRPWQGPGQDGQLGQGPLDGEPARLDHDHLWRQPGQDVWPDGRGWFSGRKPQRLAAGQLDQLGHPQPTQQHRLDPLHRDHPGAARRPARHGRDLLDPVAQPGHHPRPGGPAADRLGHPHDVIQDVAQAARMQADQPQVGLGGQPRDRGPDVVDADRADPAQVLGHDYVRGQRGQQLGVDVVDGQGVGDQLADRTVHAGAGG